MKTETRERFFSSSDQSWATPPELFKRFDDVFSFVLDPCAHPLTAKCKRFITKEVDGLTQDWSSIGNSFVNPPFSKELPKWIAKSYEESKKGIIVAMLIPARPDTKAWHKYCFPYAKILFIKGRIVFLDQREDVEEKCNNPAFFPSALVVFGDLTGKEIEKLDDLGVWIEASLAYSEGFEHKDFEQCEKSCPFVSQHKMEGKLAEIELADKKLIEITEQFEHSEMPMITKISFILTNYKTWLKSQLSEVKQE
jgi:phage N-6-adenine-methyltransferase